MGSSILENSLTSKSADELRSASLCRTAVGCLAAGTHVAMADGSWRPVENVHTRDQVISLSEAGERTVQTVKTQFRNTATVMHRISWDADKNGIADGTVSATSKHPFHVPGVSPRTVTKRD
jgi:hypothetical protein